MVEADIFLPSFTPPATNWIVLVNPDGSSPARPWPVLPAGKLREEKEPNGSFKAAQPLEPGATVQGSIKEPGDVDVFRWTARRGTTYRIAVSAAGLGSPLDGAVTVTDSRGHQQAVMDDTASSSDPTLLWKAPADGDYFLTVMDALDKGSALHVYLLQLTVEAE